MKLFSKVDDWWNPSGSMFALWEYNHLRIQFVRQIVKSLADNNFNYRYPLEG
jgi:hypothetical protein